MLRVATAPPDPALAGAVVAKTQGSRGHVVALMAGPCRCWSLDVGRSVEDWLRLEDEHQAPTALDVFLACRAISAFPRLGSLQAGFGLAFDRVFPPRSQLQVGVRVPMPLAPTKVGLRGRSGARRLVVHPCSPLATALKDVAR